MVVTKDMHNLQLFFSLGPVLVTQSLSLMGVGGDRDSFLIIPLFPLYSKTRGPVLEIMTPGGGGGGGERGSLSLDCKRA